MEIADRESHGIIVRYARELIALFFIKNLQYCSKRTPVHEKGI